MEPHELHLAAETFGLYDPRIGAWLLAKAGDSTVFAKSAESFERLLSIAREMRAASMQSDTRTLLLGLASAELQRMGVPRDELTTTTKNAGPRPEPNTTEEEAGKRRPAGGTGMNLEKVLAAADALQNSGRLPEGVTQEVTELAMTDYAKSRAKDGESVGEAMARLMSESDEDVRQAARRRLPRRGGRPTAQSADAPRREDGRRRPLRRPGRGRVRSGLRRLEARVLRPRAVFRPFDELSLPLVQAYCAARCRKAETGRWSGLRAEAARTGADPHALLCLTLGLLPEFQGPDMPPGRWLQVYGRPRVRPRVVVTSRDALAAALTAPDTLCADFHLADGTRLRRDYLDEHVRRWDEEHAA